MPTPPHFAKHAMFNDSSAADQIDDGDDSLIEDNVILCASNNKLATNSTNLSANSAKLFMSSFSVKKQLEQTRFSSQTSSEIATSASHFVSVTSDSLVIPTYDTTMSATATTSVVPSSLSTTTTREPLSFCPSSKEQTLLHLPSKEIVISPELAKLEALRHHALVAKAMSKVLRPDTSKSNESADIMANDVQDSSVDEIEVGDDVSFCFKRRTERSQLSTTLVTPTFNATVSGSATISVAPSSSVWSTEAGDPDLEKAEGKQSTCHRPLLISSVNNESLNERDVNAFSAANLDTSESFLSAADEAEQKIKNDVAIELSSHASDDNDKNDSEAKTFENVEEKVNEERMCGEIKKKDSEVKMCGDIKEKNSEERMYEDNKENAMEENMYDDISIDDKRLGENMTSQLSDDFTNHSIIRLPTPPLQLMYPVEQQYDSRTADDTNKIEDNSTSAYNFDVKVVT